MRSSWFLFLAGLLVICGMAAGGPEPGAAGTAQPLFHTADRCVACHNGLVTPIGEDASMGTDWKPSMMANSSRDPYWQAAVRRESLDHPGAGPDIENECSTCHMPMAHAEAGAAGSKFGVFAYLPTVQGSLRADLLAADGVSCTACHQIQDRGLGEKESFTGGFVIDARTPIGNRFIYGPYDVDRGRRTVMNSASGFVPEMASHIISSEMCATCHTLYTHTLGADGNVIGQLPEQVPYLEWRHSGYYQIRSCASCHMPVMEGETAITSVLGQPRDRLARHVFRAGNFFMPRIFARYGADLAVTASLQELDSASQRTLEHLENDSARLTIADVDVSPGKMMAEILVESLAGHKLPSAYPSRRAWIHFTVRGKQGGLLFESGAFLPDGSIAGNDNDSDPGRYEPHYEEIDDPEKVQIYEAIMADSDGGPTTGLLTGLRYIKDNRLLPLGFDKASAAEDIATQGNARRDNNFGAGGDRVRYAVSLGKVSDSYTIHAELWYQPIGYRWAQNLGGRNAEETDRFVAYYESMAKISAVVLARAKVAIGPGQQSR